MNPDGTFNFLRHRHSFHKRPARRRGIVQPFILHVGKLRIIGARAAVADMMADTPYKRLLGPLDLQLENSAPPE